MDFARRSGSRQWLRNPSLARRGSGSILLAVAGNLPRFYDSALQRFGRDPKDHYITQLRAVHVAETREQAWDDAEQHLYYMMSTYDRRLKEAADLPWSQALFSCPQVPPPGEMRKTPGLTFF